MDSTTYPYSSTNQDSPRTSSDSRTHRINGAAAATSQDESAWRRRMHKRVGSRDNQDMEVLLTNEKVESLRRELEAERRMRNDEIKNIQRSLQRVYHDCANLASRDAEQLVDLENKVDALSQRYRADHGELNTLRKRLDVMESLATSLRTRIEPNEHQPRQTQPQEQQRYHDSPQQPQEQQRNSLPQSFGGDPNRATHASAVGSPWTAQIIWVLSASRPNVSEVDGVAYLKLQSRSTRNKVFFTADTSLSFFLGIEGSFINVIRSRAWMPLASHKTSESDEVARITLDKLPARMRDDRLWTRAWLEEHCVTYDSAGKPHIYIALQEEDLTLAELDGVASTATATKTAATNRIDSVHAGQPLPPLPPQVVTTTTTASTTPVYPSTHNSTRANTPKPIDTTAIPTTTTPTPLKAALPSHQAPQQSQYFHSAPTTARVSIDSPLQSQTITPFTSTGLSTPTLPPPGPTAFSNANPAAHPAHRNKSRSASLQLSALPQYPTPHSTRPGPLSPQEEALLAHKPQPGLHPIPAGGTDEAASSIAASEFRRNRSLGKAERLLGRTHAGREQQRPKIVGDGNASTSRMGQRSTSGGPILQKVGSYGQQSRDGGGMAVFDTPPRPASANALDAFQSPNQNQNQNQTRLAPPLQVEEGRLSPKKKKSFGRLVERLTGRSRNSLSAPGTGTGAKAR